MASYQGQVHCGARMQSPLQVDLQAGVAVVFAAPDPLGVPQRVNEDSIALIERRDGLVLAVADGGGGGPEGEKASALAVTELRDALAAKTPLREAILRGIEAANTAVLGLGGGSFTTLSVATIVEDHIQTYQVGDSAVLVFGQRGKIKMQTLSHSPVGYAVEAGLLDEQDAMHHHERHLVSNVLGSSEMRLELGSPLPLLARDRVLIASDGLFDNLQNTEIVDAARCGPAVQAVGDLVTECHARMRGESEAPLRKQDDLSLILFHR